MTTCPGMPGYWDDCEWVTGHTPPIDTAPIEVLVVVAGLVLLLVVVGVIGWAISSITQS